jgi:hypothetical protein
MPDRKRRKPDKTEYERGREAPMVISPRRVLQLARYLWRRRTS